MKKFNVAVVGIGAVGKEMVRQLLKRQFPMSSLSIFAQSARNEIIDGKEYPVEKITFESFNDIDIAFFAGTEGEKGASQVYGKIAQESGCVVIDNGADFRKESTVPLVIPEINSDALLGHHGIVANPNCSTIAALVAAASLHREWRIKRMVASTYQAVSGSGSQAIKELDTQTRARLSGEEIHPEVYRHPIAFNAIPQVGSLDASTGAYSEEIKMLEETRKILGDDSIQVAATCVRVPVFNGHGIAMNLEFKRTPNVKTARDLLSRAPGICVVDDPENGIYPMPIDASGREDVLVGRIRMDPSVENGLVLWVCMDNVIKGAALNAVQIGELLIKNELLNW